MVSTVKTYWMWDQSKNMPEVIRSPGTLLIKVFKIRVNSNYLFCKCHCVIGLPIVLPIELPIELPIALPIELPIVLH